MKQRKDPVIRALEDADPSPIERGWSRSDEGRAVARQIRMKAAAEDASAPVRASRRRRWRRPVVALVAVVAVLGLGARLAVDRREPSTTTLVACYPTFNDAKDATVIGVPPDMTPIDACATNWQQLFGVRVPPHLAACVHVGGGPAIFPRPASLTSEEACSSMGFAAFDS